MLRRTIPVMVLWTAVFSTATTPGVAMAAAIIGTAAAETPGGINVGNLPGAITAAQGISIAGVRAQAAEKYSIGNPPAMISANELQTMKSVMDLTITAFGKPLTPAGLAATQKTYATAALRLFTNEMPADFKLQNKKINDLATDMLAVGDVKAAAANAFATQTARGNKPSTKGTDASALANGANTAGAYALNIDPYAV